MPKYVIKEKEGLVGKFLGAINIKSSVETHAIVAEKTVFFLTVRGDLLAYR